MSIGKSCHVVFMPCRVMSCYQRISQRALLCSKKFFHVCPQEFRSSNMSANSEAPYTADAQSTYHTALQSRTEWHCCHRQTVLGLNDNSVTNCSLTNAATISDFMNWMTLQSQADCSWTELWHCSHKQTVHGLNDTAVTDRLFMDWMTLRSDRLFMDWMTLQSQTVYGLNDTAVTEFMDWMTLRSQTECSWIELWHCSHKQTVHGLNDTAVTNRVRGLNDAAVTNRLFMDWMTLQSQTEFMDWMTLQSQTDCLWTEWWHCSHRIFMDWMTLQSQTEFMDWMTLQSQTDCSWTEWHCSHKQSSWTEWHCSHKQTVHGLNDDTAVTNRLFMDWMTLQSQTEFIDWMTLQSQTDCLWTDQCSSHIKLHGLNDISQAHSFCNSQNLRPKVLTAVLLRIQVFYDVMLYVWVSGSWHLKVSQYLHNIRNPAPNHTVSHPRTPELSIHTNFLTLLFPEGLRVQLFHE